MFISPTLAFHAASFFSDLLAAGIFAVLFFGSLALLAEDRSRDKLGTYAMAAACTGVLFWILAMTGWLLFGQLLEIIGLVFWVSYKWLDFTFLRSVGVVAAVLAAMHLSTLLLA